MRTLAAVALFLILAGCADAPVAPPSDSIFLDQSFKPASVRIDPDAVLQLSEPMLHYLHGEISGQIRLEGRKEGLVDALYRKGQLKLEYDAGMTRNAAEAFDARSGNCLSLVIMTSAFARQLGVPVHYQLVLANETWSRNGDLYLAIGHVNLVLGNLHRSDVLYGHDEDAITTIDFMPEPHARSLPTRSISEATVIAMYMNNRAVETLARGQVDDAYWFARAAIHADPRFLNAYNTLGAIYVRHGDNEMAARVFQLSLDRDPRNTDAMANLIPVLKTLGRTSEADAMAATLHRIEPNPPFADFNRGLAAMRLGHYSEARDYFAKEVARDPWYHEFHYWLGLAYLRLGDAANAGDQMALAMENSTTRHDYELYAAKRDRILGVSSQ
jgi:tetratricopeptide (TPR) repeat protein